MEKIIRSILRMDKGIRKFYILYFMAFITILGFFIVMLEENFSITILMGSWVVVSFLLLVMPCLRDFTSAVSGTYCRIEGRAKEKGKDIYSWRLLDIYTNDGNRVCNINVWEKKQVNNKYVVIEYLPNTKFGKVLIHSRNPELTD